MQMISAPELPLYAPKPVQAEELEARLGPYLADTDDRSLLLYLHVPFCSSKCAFCNWVSEIPVPQLRSGAPVRSDYTTAICKQIRAVSSPLNSLRYEPAHIYWGGGTPSMLSGDEIQQIVETLARSFDLSGIEEHTMETSPETLTIEKLRAMRSAGINRVSMGVQSFDDAELRRAGRAHSSATASHAIHLIREAGFGSLNLDLIVGFPYQTLDVLQGTIKTTIQLAPEHVTVYVYRAEPDTVMARQIQDGHRKAPKLEDNLAAYELACTMLNEAGYFEYTVGYFAKKEECRFKGEDYYFGLHGDYIGFGCGGESVLGHHSLINPSGRLQEFLARPTEFARAEAFSITRLDAILRALRLTILTEQGIEYKRFQRVFGFPFSSVRNHPYVSGLLRYLQYCGAEFVETAESLSVSKATRSRSYIVALQRKFYSPRSENPASESTN